MSFNYSYIRSEVEFSYMVEGTQLRVPLEARIQWTERSRDLGEGIDENWFVLRKV